MRCSFFDLWNRRKWESADRIKSDIQKEVREGECTSNDGLPVTLTNEYIATNIGASIVT